VQSGWLFRYKRREDGSRQILGFVLPGDIVGLHRRVLPYSPHSLQSVTAVRMATISDTQIASLAAEQPRLMEAIFWLSAQEMSRLSTHVLRLGRMSARERLAHVLLELWTRLSWVGETDGDSFFFPLTQEMLADALGLSVMHIHRMLHDLQSAELIAIEDRRIWLRDRRALTELAEFDPDYLAPGRAFGP
jgi:CRP-like cAMP-binding protein